MEAAEAKNLPEARHYIDLGLLANWAPIELPFGRVGPWKILNKGSGDPERMRLPCSRKRAVTWSQGG